MDRVMEYISSHPMAIMGAAFIALLIFYFLFKQLIKLALFLILIALIVGGYYYFKDPKQAPANISQTLKETREKTGKLLEQGKQAYKTGKELYDKGKDLTKQAGGFFNKNEEKTGRNPE